MVCLGMSTPNYASWESVKDQVAATLRAGGAANLPTDWDAICAHAARRATATLRTIFIPKGYTPDQLAASEDIFTYAQQLATYYALTAGTSLCSIDARTIEWMNCEKELRENGALIISDAGAAPGPSDIGGIHSGTVSAVATEEARFRRL